MGRWLWGLTNADVQPLDRGLLPDQRVKVGANIERESQIFFFAVFRNRY